MELANVLCRGTNHRQPRQHGKHGNVGTTPSTQLLGRVQSIFSVLKQQSISYAVALELSVAKERERERCEDVRC